MSTKAKITAALPPLADTEKRTFRFEPLYSGDEAFVDQFKYPVVVDIATLDIGDECPALIDHDPQMIVGTLKNIRKSKIDGIDCVVCDAVVGGTIYAKQLLEYIDAKIHPLGPSIGAGRTNTYNEVFYPEGTEFTMNGVKHVGPKIGLYNASTLEGSFVSQKGDRKAKILSAALKSLTKNTTMTFEEFLESKGTTQEDFDALSEEEKAALEEEHKSSGEEEEASASLDDGDESGGSDDGSSGSGESFKTAALEVIEEEIASATPSQVAEIVEDVVNRIESPEMMAAMKKGKLSVKDLLRPMVKASFARKKKAKGSTLDETRRVAALTAMLSTRRDRTEQAIILNAIENGNSAASVRDAFGSIDNSKKKAAKMTASFNKSFNIGMDRNEGISMGDKLKYRITRQSGMSDEEIAKYVPFDAGADKVLNANFKDKRTFCNFKTLYAEAGNAINPGYLNTFSDDVLGIVEASRTLTDTHRKRAIAAGYSRRGALTRDMRPAMTASMSFSTLFADDILHAVVEALFERAQETAPTIYKELTKEVYTKDLNAIQMYQADLIGKLRTFSGTGPVPSATVESSNMSVQSELKGVIITFPETYLINDQLDSFTDLINQMGQLAEQTTENEVAMLFQSLMAQVAKDQSGNTFFSDANGNIIDTGSELTPESMRRAMEKFQNFTNQNGFPLSQTGAFLLAGTKVYEKARMYYESTNIFENGTGGDNTMKGRIPPKLWVFLNDNFVPPASEWTTPYKAYGEASWLYMADPQKRPVVSVARLRGYESARMDQGDMNLSYLGIQYRLVHAFKANVMYPNGAVMMTGKAAT